MASHDWSRFKLRIPIKASTSQIFDAWTTPAGLQSWFLRKAIFNSLNGEPRKENERIQPGDTYQWFWFGYNDDIVEPGTIITHNKKDHLQFTFGKAGNVAITIKEEQGDTLLILEQTEIPTDESSQINFYLGCSKGWLFYLTNLKSILEGGLDLRNKKVELKGVITA